MLRIRAPLACLVVALVVSGCMRTPAPVATTQATLDTMAYGG